MEKIHDEITIKIYRNGGFKDDVYFSTTLSNFQNLQNKQMKELLKRASLKLDCFAIKSDYKLFDFVGNEISEFKDLEFGRIYFLLVERGETFIFPSWEINSYLYLRHVKDYEGNPLKLKVVSQKPRVFTIDKLFSNKEIDQLLSIKQCARWENSTQFSPDGKLYVSSTRNSRSGWMEENCGEIVKIFNEKIESIHKVKGQSEDLQLIHYGVGEHYFRHHDAHPSNHYHYNRLITFLIYLNDVEAGGCTAFPFATDLRDNREPHSIPYSECVGLKICPTRGQIAMFYNLEIPNMMDGNVDFYSAHLGCDVIKGEKYAANKWIWNRPYDWKNNPKFV